MKTFLVLEDEGFIALDLELAFKEAGHNALIAAECSEALEIIRKQSISGAVLDVSLGGGKTCEDAAVELAERGMPFLLHTGDLNRVGEGLSRFGVPILEKPMASDAVVAKMLDLAALN